MDFINKLANFGKKGIAFGKETYSTMHKEQQRRKAYELQRLRTERIRLEGEAELKELKEKELKKIREARKRIYGNQRQQKVPDIMKGFGL